MTPEQIKRLQQLVIDNWNSYEPSYYMAETMYYIMIDKPQPEVYGSNLQPPTFE